jgi:hypothetical protein
MATRKRKLLKVIILGDSGCDRMLGVYLTRAVQTSCIKGYNSIMSAAELIHHEPSAASLDQQQFKYDSYQHRSVNAVHAGPVQLFRGMMLRASLHPKVPTTARTVLQLCHAGTAAENSSPIL